MPSGPGFPPGGPAGCVASNPWSETTVSCGTSLASSKNVCREGTCVHEVHYALCAPSKAPQLCLLKLSPTTTVGTPVSSFAIPLTSIATITRLSSSVRGTGRQIFKVHEESRPPSLFSGTAWVKIGDCCRVTATVPNFYPHDDEVAHFLRLLALRRDEQENSDCATTIATALSHHRVLEGMDVLGVGAVGEYFPRMCVDFCLLLAVCACRRSSPASCAGWLTLCFCC